MIELVAWFNCMDMIMMVIVMLFVAIDTSLGVSFEEPDEAINEVLELKSKVDVLERSRECLQD